MQANQNLAHREQWWVRACRLVMNLHTESKQWRHLEDVCIYTTSAPLLLWIIFQKLILSGGLYVYFCFQKYTMSFNQSTGIIEMFMDSLEVTDEGTFTFNLVDGKAKGTTSLVLIGDGKTSNEVFTSILMCRLINYFWRLNSWSHVCWVCCICCS